MTRIVRPAVLLGLLALLLFAASPIWAANADESGFTPIFDGKTLKGWNGNLKVFRVEEGAIVGGTMKERIAHNDFLAYEKEFADFELRLKFKLIGKGVNGGVQIRSRRIPNNFEMSGYQADLGDNYWGSLYDESRRNKTLIAPKAELIQKVLKREAWNDYTIRCQGRHIQLWMNGEQTVDYTEPDEKIEQTGLIALQIHAGEPSEAWYKDLRIKVLSSTDAKAEKKSK
ncbi:MAG TPA: DUF1080 domain-containing protein [Pirellulales bacterium]|nr:DUF1080 domain-containing protein [Pirellulales bacterium]